MNIEGLDVKAYKKKLSVFLTKAAKLKVFILSALLLTMFGFIFWRITYYSEREPTEAMLQEQRRATTRPNIDPELVKRLETLESENVEVQALFNEARKNPFSE